MNLHNAKITMVIDDETYEIKPDDINITFMEHGLGHHVSIGGRLTLVSVNVAGVEEKVIRGCDLGYSETSVEQAFDQVGELKKCTRYFEQGEAHNRMVTKMDDHKGCNHKWKNYHGFSESYQYCEKCPEKKPLEDS